MCVRVFTNRVCVCAREYVGLCVCIYTSRCMYEYICMLMYTRLYVCLGVYKSMCVYVLVYYMCLVACYNVSYSFRRSKIGNRRVGFVPIMNPIQWRFKDRHMGWSRDPYQFVQWKPEGDSDPKPCHFMWVFAFISFFYLLLSICICVLLLSFHVTIWCILSVWLLVSLHETSMIVHLIYIVDLSNYQRHYMC